MFIRTVPALRFVETEWPERKQNLKYCSRCIISTTFMYSSRHSHFLALHCVSLLRIISREISARQTRSTPARAVVRNKAAVFVPEVAKQHDVFAGAIAFGVFVSARASFWLDKKISEILRLLPVNFLHENLPKPAFVPPILKTNQREWWVPKGKEACQGVYRLRPPCLPVLLGFLRV